MRLPLDPMNELVRRLVLITGQLDQGRHLAYLEQAE